jgi:hypothetical protein
VRCSAPGWRTSFTRFTPVATWRFSPVP